MTYDDIYDFIDDLVDDEDWSDIDVLIESVRQKESSAGKLSNWLNNKGYSVLGGLYYEAPFLERVEKRQTEEQAAEVSSVLGGIRSAKTESELQELVPSRAELKRDFGEDTAADILKELDERASEISEVERARDLEDLEFESARIYQGLRSELQGASEDERESILSGLDDVANLTGEGRDRLRDEFG